MRDPGERALSVSEWLVLCIACEEPTYGHAIADLFGRGGSLRGVWQVSKPAVYRAIDRLQRLGLVHWAGQQRSNEGPVRCLVTATRSGREAARVWLRTPVAHGRDVPSELMIKLALLHRAGEDARDLLSRQRAAFGALAAALADRVGETSGMEHTLALYRHEMMSATIEFLDQAAWQAELAAAPGPGGHPDHHTNVTQSARRRQALLMRPGIRDLHG